MLISTLCPGRKIEWLRPLCVPYARRHRKRQTVMLKSIIAIVVSYVAMFVLFMAVFTGLYFLFGVERVFQPDSYAVSTLWITVTLIGALLGGMFGGFLCATISKSWRTCQVLALVVFLLALIQCVSALRKS